MSFRLGQGKVPNSSTRGYQKERLSNSAHEFRHQDTRRASRTSASGHSRVRRSSAKLHQTGLIQEPESQALRFFIVRRDANTRCQQHPGASIEPSEVAKIQQIENHSISNRSCCPYQEARERAKETR